GGAQYRAGFESRRDAMGRRHVGVESGQQIRSVLLPIWRDENHRPPPGTRTARPRLTAPLDGRHGKPNLLPASFASRPRWFLFLFRFWIFLPSFRAVTPRRL